MLVKKGLQRKYVVGGSGISGPRGAGVGDFFKGIFSKIARLASRTKNSEFVTKGINAIKSATQTDIGKAVLSGAKDVGIGAVGAVKDKLLQRLKGNDTAKKAAAAQMSSPISLEAVKNDVISAALATPSGGNLKEIRSIVRRVNGGGMKRIY